MNYCVKSEFSVNACGHLTNFYGSLPRVQESLVRFSSGLQSITLTVLLWEKKCDGSTGACLCYDNYALMRLVGQKLGIRPVKTFYSNQNSLSCGDPA